MMALIPVVAISPILLYIGMLIGAQAFQETPRSHAPAVIIALIPQVAGWGKVQIDNVLAAAGTNAATVGIDKMAQGGVLYHGLEIFGSGAILISVIMASITACMIDRQYSKASAFALAGAVLTFFGFMHSEAIGINKTPLVAISYLGVAAVLFACARTVAAPKTSPVTFYDGHEPPATDALLEPSNSSA
jgi:AGZA family xanthine/uracil permease-like MFS transporter